MAKMPIEWHEKALKSSEYEYERERMRVREDIDKLTRWMLSNSAYRRQIARAKREGRDGFDRERFNQGEEK